MAIKNSVKCQKNTSKVVSPETTSFINKIKVLTREISASKEKSRDFLIKTGIYNKNGSLSKAYR